MSEPAQDAQNDQTIGSDNAPANSANHTIDGTPAPAEPDAVVPDQTGSTHVYQPGDVITVNGETGVVQSHDGPAGWIRYLVTHGRTSDYRMEHVANSVVKFATAAEKEVSELVDAAEKHFISEPAPEDPVDGKKRTLGVSGDEITGATVQRQPKGSGEQAETDITENAIPAQPVSE